MRLLLDECIPRKLRSYLAPHECTTLQELGWSGKRNGQLLAAAEGRFDVLMAEGGRFGRRRMVGDDGRYSAGSSGFTAAGQRVSALRFRSVGREMARESGARGRDYRSLR